MLTAIVLALFTGVIVFDLAPKLKGQPKRNKIVYWVLMSISFIVLILFTFDIVLPGPSELIKSLVKSIFKVK